MIALDCAEVKNALAFSEAVPAVRDMKWYYSARGDPARRGFVEEQVFRDMLRRGQLQSSDWVWSESTGQRWVPVGEAPGLADLFSQPAPLPLPEAGAPVRAASRRLRLWLWIALPPVLALLVVLFALLARALRS